MFYSQHVLTKKGPLAKIWLAAHMQNKLTKAMVFATDVRKAVDSIISPEVPMALRLTSNLLLGVARILYRKTKYLLQESSDAMTRLKLTFRPGANTDAAQPGAAGPSGGRGAAPTTATYNAVTLQPSVDTLIAPNLDLDLLPARPATNPTSFLAADRDITIDEFAGGLMGGMLDAFALDPELGRQDDLPGDLAEPLLFTPSERPGRATPLSSSLRSGPSTERMRAAPAESARLDTPTLEFGADSGKRQKFSVTGAAAADPEAARTALSPQPEVEPMDIGAPSSPGPAPAVPTPSTPPAEAAPDAEPVVPMRDRLSTGPSAERAAPRLSTGTDDLQLMDRDTPVPEPGAPAVPGTPAPEEGTAAAPGASAAPGTPAPPAAEAGESAAPGSPVVPGTPAATAPAPGASPKTPAAPATPLPEESPGTIAPGTPATPGLPLTPGAAAPATPATPAGAPEDSPRSEAGTPARRESAAWEPPATPGTPDTPATERRDRKRKAAVLTDVGATEMSNMDFRACLNDTSDLLRGPRPPTRRRVDPNTRYADILGRPIVTLAPALRELFEQSFHFEDRVGSPMTDADLGLGEEDEEQEGRTQKETTQEDEEEEGAEETQKDVEAPETTEAEAEVTAAAEESVAEGVAAEAAAAIPTEPISPKPEVGATDAEAQVPPVFGEDDDMPLPSPGTVTDTPAGAREPPPAVADPEPPTLDLGSPVPLPLDEGVVDESGEAKPEEEPAEGGAEAESTSQRESLPAGGVTGTSSGDMDVDAPEAADMGAEAEGGVAALEGPLLSEVAATRAQVDRAAAEEVNEATVSARTRKMQEYILAHMEGDQMDYSARLALEKPVTRRTAARTFYELLNLSSKKAVKLHQANAFGIITVAPVQPAFDALAATVSSEVAEAQ